jgi:hypothetical protein
MKSLACAVVLRQLQAYHDDELRVADQVAVATHLDGCPSCRETLEEIESVGEILRAEAPGHVPLPCDEAASFMSSVVNRARVEDEVSLLSRVRELAEDGRVAYSALGATGATLACLVIMLTMMRFAGNERTDSLAGMMNVLKAPTVVAEPIVIRPIVVDARVMMPRALDSFSGSDVDDAVLALSGLVTTEGKVSNVEINDGFGGVTMASIDSRRLESLVDAVSKTRFEPVMKEGMPVPVNMVWFVAHTTVRGGAARKPLSAHMRRVGVVHRV